MADEKPIQTLTIFLLKPIHESAESALKCEQCAPSIKVPLGESFVGQLFVKKTLPHLPKWANLFRGYVNPDSLKVPGVSAAFWIRVADRSFVLTFGQGGRFLLHDDVYEERFGLLCALNSVDPESFRCVDVQSLDAIQSHSRIQSGQATTSDQFGLDVEQDMLKAIVGAPEDESLGNRMTGSDSLTVSVRMTLHDLPKLLEEYRKRFEADLSTDDYQWVNNISAIKSTATIHALETQLELKLATKDFTGIWLSIPEIIDWAAVEGFMYTSGGRKIYPDIHLEGFLKTVPPDEQLTLDLLRRREVHCADADFKKVFASWSVFKCLYAEVDLDGRKYVLNDGKWYSVAIDFVDRTNSDFAKIPRSTISLPKYAGGGEGAYNEAVARAESTRYALLDDKKKIMHGGGHGQVEVCDLLSIDRQLIHVKMYGKSSVFSHLFAQGFVSGQLLQIDADFRKKVRAQLLAPFDALIEVGKRPAQDAFTIVYAVISDAVEPYLTLPFFSRVNLNNTAKILVGYGFKVEILKIAVDETHSKTIKGPPKKGKKH